MTEDDIFPRWGIRLNATAVPRRPTLHVPAFGAVLAELRGDRSFEQIARQIRPFVADVGLEVPPSLIHKIENGRVPSWPMLAAFSRVYEVPLLDLVAQLADDLGWRDLLSHDRTKGSGLQTGGADDTATRGRIRELEDEVDYYKGIISATRVLTQQALDALNTESGAARATKRKSRKSA